MLKEFKEFAMKGDVMDLAVGVVIGGAFQKIVTSLVEDVIMPIVAMITGKVDFSDLVLQIGSSSIKYGNFITAIINFLIIAFTIFIVIRYINKINNLGSNLIKKNEKDETEKTEPETKTCPYCLSEIPYKAVKCAHCASEIETTETASNK